MAPPVRFLLGGDLGSPAPTWCRGRGPSAAPPLLLRWRGIGAGLVTRGCSRRATPARGRSPRRLRDARLVAFCQSSLPFSCGSCPHPPSSRLTGHLSLRCDWDLEAAGGLDGTVPGGERRGSRRQHRAARTLQPQPREYQEGGRESSLFSQNSKTVNEPPVGRAKVADRKKCFYLILFTSQRIGKRCFLFWFAF